MIRAKHILIFCTLVLCSVLAMKVYGQMTWSKMYGGQGLDEAFCNVALSNQTYVLAGHSNSFGSEDLWVIDVDASGDIIWEKTLSGAGSGVANSATRNGFDFVLVGYIWSASGDKDLWVIKLDNSGNVIWQRSIGTASDDEGYSIEGTIDGYIVAGTTGVSRDAWIVKLDNNGNVMWQKSYGTAGDDTAYSIIFDFFNNCYFFAGTYNSQNLWVVKLDLNGDVLWQKTYLSQSNFGDIAKSIIPTPSDGGFLITGTKDASNLGRSYDVWVLKLDSSGNLQWEKTFGSPASDYGESALHVGFGNYIVAGSTDRLSPGAFQPWMMKLDQQGNTLWQKFYPPGYLRTIGLTIDGGISFGGFGLPEQKFWAVKADANGDLLSVCNQVTPGDFDFVSLNSVTSDTSVTSQTTVANVLDTSAIAMDTAAFVLSRCATPCLFCDEFEDGILNPSWTYKGSWNENGGALVGDPKSRALAIASPIFAGCSSCSIETALQANANGKVIFLSWFQDKKNALELIMDEAKDKWVFRRKLNGKIVNKLKAARTIDPNQSYAVVTMFEGNSWRVFINGEFLFEILDTFGGTPSGTVGLKVRSTTGAMEYIHVN